MYIRITFKDGTDEEYFEAHGIEFEHAFCLVYKDPQKNQEFSSIHWPVNDIKSIECIEYNEAHEESNE